MQNELSYPRPEFNGHSACPYVKKYMHRIEIVEVEQGIKEPIETACSMLEPLGLMAVVLAFPRKPPIGSIKRVVDDILNSPLGEDKEILISNHRLKGTYRGVYTGFRHCDLVVVQSESRLKMARLHLKKQGYYK